ncbi:MAG: trimeric intracellular cation channel family protein [Planctomycetota bacterium]|nr:MAG: trimeric intracellular cation channel family protein [Planctomycetota bacterium]
MVDPNVPLTASILALMYGGDVVFSISGALTAGRSRMDIIGFVLIGTITGIGGGTTRDLLLGRTVWWTENPSELILCIAAALATFLFIRTDISKHRVMVWADAVGLAAFAIVGCHIALEFGSPFVIAVFMGMVTATGGGVIRDVLTGNRPMVLCGQIYATAALAGSLGYATLIYLGAAELPAEIIAVAAALSLRASAILFDIRMGPPGEWICVKRTRTTVVEEQVESQLIG